MEHVDRYLPTIKALAERALGMAVDASPTRPRENEHARSLMEWVPVAKGLLSGVFVDVDYLDSLQAIVEQRAIRFVDGFGHSRPHYLLLASGLHRSGLAENPDAHLHDSHAFASAYWGLVHALEGGYRFELPLLVAAVTPGEPTADTHVECGLVLGATGGPLHEVDARVSPDDWTYAELSGLHGLFNAAAGAGRGAWFERARSTALYHLHHTQPDYTTYQPWALAAFLWFPETVPFAEQQLHDVQTHLSVEGPPGALVPGLLLADAYATLRELRERQGA